MSCLGSSPVLWDRKHLQGEIQDAYWFHFVSSSQETQYCPENSYFMYVVQFSSCL